MRVAVVGASGRSGRAVASHAIAAGHDVVSVVRSASTAPEGTTVAIAHAREVAALTTAFAGVDAVVSCLGHSREGNSKDGDTTVLADGAAAALEAMRAAGVNRLVAISAAGAFVQGDDPLSRYIAKPIVARLFGEPFADTRAMEAEIRASDVHWTLLRPSRLVAGKGRQPYRSGIERAVWWHYSTTFDTAGRASVDALSNPAWTNHAVFITD